MSGSYTDKLVDERRYPSKQYYSDEELIGKYVRVVSKASHKHYGEYGKIVGVNDGTLHCITVYLPDSKVSAKFCRKSLELLTL